MHSKDMSLVTRLERQALACSQLGSHLYAALLTAAAADVRAGGPCAEVLAGYENAPRNSAIALRLLAGVHSLVLCGRAPELAAHYPSAGGDAGRPEAAWLAFRSVVAAEQDWIRDWLTRPPQTNEVARSAPLLAGLLAAVDAIPLPVRLLELGSSAGLNLRADRFRWTAGEVAWGPVDSPVVIEDAWPDGVPGWLAAAVRRHPEVTVVERLGCDPNPLDPLSEPGSLALRSYLWPDQTYRAARLQGALLLAGRIPAEVVAIGADDFLAGLELRPGTLTVVWHSVMRQYLTDAQRSRMQAELDRLAAGSTPDAGFAHISFEPLGTPDDSQGFPITIRIGAGPVTSLGKAMPHGIPVFP